MPTYVWNEERFAPFFRGAATLVRRLASERRWLGKVASLDIRHRLISSALAPDDLVDAGQERRPLIATPRKAPRAFRRVIAE
jgi:hypothetical protein